MWKCWWLAVVVVVDVMVVLAVVLEVSRQTVHWLSLLNHTRSLLEPVVPVQPAEGPEVRRVVVLHSAPLLLRVAVAVVHAMVAMGPAVPAVRVAAVVGLTPYKREELETPQALRHPRAITEGVTLVPVLVQIRLPVAAAVRARLVVILAVVSQAPAAQVLHRLFLVWPRPMRVVVAVV